MNHPYILKKNIRSKNIRVSIYRNGELVVTAPPHIDMSIIEKFLHEKTDWIERQLLKFFRRRVQYATHKKEEIKDFSEKAMHIVQDRLVHFNQFYHFSYNKVTIKNQKSRWGSCSSKGNLQFNYKIALLEPALQDYIVVHELCHLGEFNHSKKFWDLVERTIPDYKECRKKLRSGV